MAHQPAVPPSAQPAPAGKPAPAKPAQKKRRRWPWILLGIFVLILLFVALLPSIASTGPVRNMVLGRVNQQLNGTASIDSWSLGWFSGFKLSGVKLADAQGNSVVEVQSVTVPASVPALLGSFKQLGTISVVSPKANIVLYADGTNNLTQLVKPSTTPPAPAKPPQPLGFDVAADIAVTNGEISVQPAGSAKPFLIRDLNVDVKIASLEKPITLDVKAALGDERAPLTVKASATAFHAGKADPNAVEADVAVTLGGMEIGPIAALARQYGSPVEAGGVLTVQKLNAQVRGMASITAAGDIALKQLALSGGPLGKDQPKFDQVGLTFDVSKTGGTIKITNFTFDSPVATAAASGSLEMAAAGKLPKGSMTATAQVNLPALAAQLPDTLKLQKGLTIEKGSVKLDAKLDSDDVGPRVSASLSIADVTAMNQGKEIALEAPIALDLKASLTDQGPRLDDLRLTSSFASVTGAGSMEKFDLTLTSDLAAALREAAKFVDLGGKQCSGQASLALHVAGAGREKTISGDATLTNLALTGFTPSPVSLSEAKATLGATALLDEKNALQSISALKLGLTAPFATATISADSIALTPGQPMPAIQNLQASLQADLGGAVRFAADAGLMPAGKNCTGQAVLALRLSGEGRQKTISGDATLAHLALTGFTPGPVNLSEAKATLGATALLNEKNVLQSISALKVELTAPFATAAISADSIALTPGQALPTLQNGKIVVKAELGDVVGFASDAGLMPAGIGLLGEANLNAGLAVDQGVVRLAPIDVTVTDLDASQGAKHFSEPKVAVSGSIEASPAARSAKISDLKCVISAGSVTVGPVDVPDWAKAPAGVTATITGDMDIERALVSFKDFAALPAGTKVAGQAKFTLKATALADKQSVNLDATVASLKITPATGPEIDEPELSLAVDADAAPSTQTLTLNSLAINSSFYSLDAKGSLTDWGNARNLKLDGTQTCDWDKIGPLAAAFSGKPIAMSGKSKSPYHVVTSLSAEGTQKLLAATAADAALHFDLIKYMGLEIALDVPLLVKNSVATLNVTGTVNSGALKLPARVDATKPTAEFTLPANTAILTEAKITPTMADEALSNLLPIFKGCTVADGTVSLNSTNLDVPLSADALQKGTFEGSLGFKGVRMSTAGQLQSIMAAVNLAGAGGMDLARVPDQLVTLALRNGRIYQGPMKIALAGYTITISGSVGLADKTLDMGVEMPITLQMVGNRQDVYQALKDEVIRVSITGTTDKPQYSVKDSLEKLIADAAKKILEQKAQDQGKSLINQGLHNLFK